MDKKMFGFLLILAFIAGDQEAVVRANRHWRKTVEQLKRENSVRQLKLDLAKRYFDSTDFDDIPDDELEKIKADIEFIALIENKQL